MSFRAQSFVALVVLASAVLPAHAQDPDIDRLLKKLPPPEKLVNPHVKQTINEQRYKIAGNEPLLRDLSRAASAGDAARVFGVLQQMGKKYPTNPGIPYLYGAIAIELDRYALAAPAFARAAVLDPSLTAAHFAAGFSYLMADQAKTALPHLRRATQEWPNSSVSWLLLSIASENAGLIHDSAEQARHAAQIDPSNAGAWMQVARSERALHNAAAALAALVRGAQLLPDNGVVQAIVGFAFINMNRITDAIAPLERATRTQPKDYLVQSQLGFCYYAVGKMSEAIPHLKKGASLNPKYGPVWLHLGSAYLKTGRYQEAATALENARRLMPENPLARERLAEANRALGGTNRIARQASPAQIR